MAFPARRCWTVDKWIQWQGALFLCLRTWSQCLWGSCWRMQFAGHPVEGTHQVLFGRHPPVLWLVSFGHSIGVAWWHSWQWDPLSSGSWHLPFHPMRRPPLAWALPGVGSVWWLRCGMKFPMYVTIPMKLASCCLSVGGVISVIPCIFFGQGCMPSALYSAPKNETLGCLSSNFLLFSTKPSIWATLRRLTRLASWSSSDTPYTTMSSWMLMTPGQPFHDEVHLHLEDILWHLGSKGHSLEPVPAFVGVYYQ